MRFIVSTLSPKLPFYLVYMLQQVEYDPSKFIGWMYHLLVNNISFTSVAKRKTLVFTDKVKALLGLSYGFLLLSAGVIAYVGLALSNIYIFLFLMLIPAALIGLLVVVVYAAFRLIVLPQQARILDDGSKIFSGLSATKIAILGSFGKTSMKEMLKTVLSEHMNVAATPGNRNVIVSHARFAATLGSEELVIVEFGEGQPGDIKSMANLVQPDIAIVTGLAPNHLDKYSSIDEIADDFLSITDYTPQDKTFFAGDSSLLKKYLSNDVLLYSSQVVLGWNISKTEVDINGTSFTMKKGKSSVEIATTLLGEHQVAPVALCAALAIELGATEEEVAKGCSKIQPYEHRMQSRNLNGAWIIDDTYNGNLEGVKAGLNLLSDIKAKRKWYVTPGLVDQGEETVRVHTELGSAIAVAAPDIVVLMNNSVTDTIKSSMDAAGYQGEVRIEADPLEFYTNIEHIIASGDLVLMQNDWTDNYN